MTSPEVLDPEAVELYDYKPSLIDKTFLVGHSIQAAYKLSKSAVLFVCGGKSPHLMLKCSIGGNVKFHRIQRNEIAAYRQAYERAKALL